MFKKTVLFVLAFLMISCCLAISTPLQLVAQAAGMITGTKTVYTVDTSGDWADLQAPDICAIDKDNIVIVWRNALDGKVDMGDIMFMWSSDAGETWSTPGYIAQHDTSTYGYGNVVLYDDKNGNLYCYYGRSDYSDPDSEEQYQQCKKSTDNGHTWQSISLSFGADCEPCYSGGNIIKYGDLYLWPTMENLMPADYDQKILISPDLINWSLALIIPDPEVHGTGEGFIAVDQADMNKLVIKMRQGTDSTWMEYTSESIDGGYTWTNATRDSNLPNNKSKAPFVKDSNGVNILLYCSDINRTDLNYMYKTDSDTAWSSENTFYNGTGTDMYPMISEYEPGKYYAVWVHDRKMELLFAKFDISSEFPSCEAYLKMDENSGTSVPDWSGNSNDGTTTAVTWDEGYNNNGLDFNGTSSYVDLGNPADLQFGTEDFTVSTWVKADDVSSDRFIFWYGDAGVDTNQWWLKSESGKLRFLLDSTSGPTITNIVTDDVVLDNDWHHVAVVRNGSTLKIIVDGVVEKSGSVSSDINVTSTTNGLTIGKDKGDIGRYWDGKIDEVRLYGAALTEAQVNNIFNVVCKFPTCKAYLKMDESSGASVSDTTVYDNVGTQTSATWTTGYIDNGLDFNGTSSYVDMGNPTDLQFGAGDFTASAWVKADDVNSTRILFWYGDTGADTNQWWLRSVSGRLVFLLDSTDGPAVTNIATDDVVLDNDWHHVAVVRNGSTLKIIVDGVVEKSGSVSSDINVTSTTNGLTIGKDKGDIGRYWDGKIDEVRLYGAAMSDKQVENLYNSQNGYISCRSYLKMDESSGASVSDTTVYDNDGAQAWATWTMGYIDNGLDFNGTSSYVDMGNPTDLQFGAGDFTASAWVKADDVNSTRILFWYGDSGADTSQWWLRSVSGRLVFLLDSTDGPAVTNIATDDVVLDNDWHHVAIVRNGSTLKIIVDGVVEKSGSVSSYINVTSTTNGLTIGKDKGDIGRYWDGKIDEVRLYNAALTEEQVESIFLN